jgi:hypothetical protein
MAKRVDNPATTIINIKVARLDNFVLNTANIAYAVTANAGTMLRGNTDLVFTPEVPVPPGRRSPSLPGSQSLRRALARTNNSTGKGGPSKATPN